MRYALGNNGYEPAETHILLDRVWDEHAVQKPTETGITGLTWGMLGNDEVGDCLVASAAHEGMSLAAQNGRKRVFDTKHVLQSYSKWTGYVLGDEATDKGTDPVASAKNRQAEGVLDVNGRGDRIGAYAFEETPDYQKLLKIVQTFGAVTLCWALPASAEQGFREGGGWEDNTWDYVKGSPIEGGHATAGVAIRDGQLVTVSWGSEAIVTEAFVEKYFEVAVVYFSGAQLGPAGATPAGLDKTALLSALHEVSGR